MTLLRPSGTAARNKPRLEIDLLHGVTRDYAYYNKLATGQYPAHIPVVQPRVEFPWAKRFILMAGIVGALGAEQPFKHPPDTSTTTDHETTRTQHLATTQEENPYVTTLFQKETAIDATKRITDSLYALGKINTNQTQFLQRTVLYALEMEERYGVPAEAALAKAALESRDGASVLARKDRNLFGIKFDASYRQQYPQRVEYWTWEHAQDNRIRAWFFRYGSERESLEHFARFLNERRERDGTLRYERVIEQRSPANFLWELARSPFSTDSAEYPKTINKLRALHLYDVVGAARQAQREHRAYERALATITANRQHTDNK